MIAAESLLPTALGLGLFTLLGGCYGLLYCAGTLRAQRALIAAGYAAYALQLAVLAALVLWSSLGWGWKIVLVASGLAYYAIPPRTLRYLIALHHAEPHAP